MWLRHKVAFQERNLVWVTALDIKNGLKTKVEPEVDLVKG